MDVFIPKVCIIEIAAVVGRYADGKLAIKDIKDQEVRTRTNEFS